VIKKRITRSIGPLLSLLIFAVALFVLHRELKEYSYHDVMGSFGELPALHVYVVLALRDEGMDYECHTFIGSRRV